MASPDEYEAAGLYDPDADTAADRLELLQWFADQGFTLDDMLGADRVGGLEALASDRRLLGGELISTADAAQIAGVSVEELEKVAAAFGFVPLDMVTDGELGFTVADAQNFRLIGALGDMFSEAELMAFYRVAGSSIGRIADASVSLFLRDVEAKHIEAGGTQVGLAQRGYDAIGLIDGLSESLDPILRRQIMQAIDRSRRTMMSEADRFHYRYAIGFVDLVGFTEVSAEMSVQDLASFLREFEGRAHDVVTAAGARVVKLIGDEVMFASSDADSACRAAAALMSGFGDDAGRVFPRGGLSYGAVLVSGGDYYGPIVNLAARLVDSAVPQELLVTTELADAVTEFSFEPGGRRSLKGFADPVVVRSLQAT